MISHASAAVAGRNRIYVTQFPFALFTIFISFYLLQIVVFREISWFYLIQLCYKQSEGQCPQTLIMYVPQLPAMNPSIIVLEGHSYIVVARLASLRNTDKLKGRQCVIAYVEV